MEKRIMRTGMSLATIAFLLLLCTAWAQPKKSGGGAAGAEFDKLMEQWTGLVRELRDIQLEFRLAKEDQRATLRKSFQEKMAQASAMMPKLAAAGEAAYKADPRDEQLRDFMLQVTFASHQLRDGFAETLRLSKLLIANIETIPEDRRSQLYLLAGASALEFGQFDEAQKYFDAAGDTAEAKKHVEVLEEEKKYWAEEQQKLAADAKANLPRVEIVTNRGPLVIELFETEAPNTVANFIHLVESGYYKGKTFHRVLPGFVIQGGAQNEDATGGPGWQIACECYGEKFRRHYRGYLSMALSGKDTGGSQFFICLSRAGTRPLDRTFTKDGEPDKGHTVFGRVIQGMELLADIQRRDPSKPQHRDITPDRIVSAKVIRKTKGKEYVPKKIGEEKEKKAKSKDAKGKDAKQPKAKEEGKKAAAKEE